MSAESVQVVDAMKAEAFAGRLLTTLNDGALCLMVSIGHRTGLFDIMGPVTAINIGRTGGKSRAERALRAGVAWRHGDRTRGPR